MGPAARRKRERKEAGLKPLPKNTIYLARSPAVAQRKKERKWAKNPRYHETYSCGTKKRYMDLAEATAKAVELNADENRGHTQQPYKCWYCPYYHVGRIVKIPASRYLYAAKDRLLLETFYGLNDREIGCLQHENVPGKHRLEGIRQRFRAALKRQMQYPQ